jgi:AsmA protein
MNTWLKRIGIALAALLALLAAAIGWFAATFDANRYSSLLTDHVQQRYQRTLAIGAPIGWSVWPRLTLKLGQVSLTEPASTAMFAKVDDASLAMQVMPLLQRQIVIDRIDVQGTQVALARDKAGRWNFDDLIAPAPKDAAPAGAAMRFDVQGIHVRSATVNLKDDKAGVTGGVEITQLSTGRIAPGAKAPVSLDVKLALSQPRANLGVAGKFELALNDALDEFGLGGMDLKLSGNAAQVQSLAATLRGDLRYAAGAGSIAAKDLAVTASAGLPGLQVSNAKLDAKALVFQPATQTIELDKLKLDVAGTQAKEAFQLALDWPQLAVKGEQLRGGALSGRFARGALQGTFASSAPAGSFDTLRLPGLKLQVTQGGAKPISATLAATAVVKPNAKSVALQDLSLKADAQGVAAKPLALSATGFADANATGAKWKLAGSLQGGAFATDGSATFAGTPTISANASFDTLDVNQFVAAPSATAASAPSGSDAPVDMSALKSVNGRFAVRAKQLAYQHYRIADAQLDATLDGGTLRIANLAGSTWGGRVQASGLAQAQANRVALKGVAQGIDIRAALKDVVGRETLEGTGRVAFDVSTAGKSVNAMKSALGGSASLQLRDGAVRGINLAKKLREAKAALSLQRDAVEKASQVEKTDFSELSASFNIQDGVARSDDLDAKSPFLRVTGAGAVDIGRGTIDYTVKSAIISTSKGQDGADIAALKGLFVPVRLSGPLAAIDWKIQWSAVAAGAAEATLKAQAEAKLKDTLGTKLGDKLGLRAPAAAASGASAPAPSVADAAKDKVKDKLKGLFGR